mmetsp:Transcript_117869/g.375774  ORF Transcript_117869/g.375774 Transcript_117869/m.375774 type:complete len:254 (-) Transcript_117869:1971-2732(-)
MPGALMLGPWSRKRFGHVQKRRCFLTSPQRKTRPAYSTANSLSPATSRLSKRETGQCICHGDQRRLACFSFKSSFRHSLGSSPAPSKGFGRGTFIQLRPPVACTTKSTMVSADRPWACSLKSGMWCFSLSTFTAASSHSLKAVRCSTAEGCVSSCDSTGSGGSLVDFLRGFCGQNGATVFSKSPKPFSKRSSCSASSSGNSGTSSASATSSCSSSGTSSAAASSPAASNSFVRRSLAACFSLMRASSCALTSS